MTYKLFAQYVTLGETLIGNEVLKLNAGEMVQVIYPNQPIGEIDASCFLIRTDRWEIDHPFVSLNGTIWGNKLGDDEGFGAYTFRRIEGANFIYHPVVELTEGQIRFLNQV